MKRILISTLSMATLLATAPLACSDDAGSPASPDGGATDAASDTGGRDVLPDTSGQDVVSDRSDQDAPADGDSPPRTTRGRLFIFTEAFPDGGTPERAYEILDLDNGASLPDLTPTPNGVTAAEDGRIGLVNFSFRAQDPGLAVLDPGLSLDSSSVPPRIVTRAPSLGPTIPAERVRNTMVSDGWIGTFSEAGSVARFFSGTPDQPRVVTIDDNGGLSSDYEVSGLAFAFAGDLYASVVSVGSPPFPGGPQPVGFRRYDTNGRRLAELMPCGDALLPGVNEEYAIIGCGDGMLILRKQAGNFSETKVPYPSANVFVTFVRATRGVPYFVLGGLNTDTFEPTDLTIYDPRGGDAGSAGSAARTIPGTADLRVYEIVPGSSTLVGITEAGELRVYDLATLAMRRLQLATQPLEAPGFPRLPFLAVPGNVAYVTSPGTRQIFEVDVAANPPVVLRTLNTRLGPTGIPAVLGAIR